MSLYGALFGGVSGIRSQGSKIGVISDNIANVNTVGYKQSQALFESLVVNANSTVSYQTGGVRGASRMAIDQQGLLLSTNAPTDIAISGGGFFVVNAQVNGSGQPLYTRAGSFRQDSLGNFVNAAGFYLQGWPLDRDGRLPGEVGNLNTTSFANLDSLETVNVESASGVAQATTTVEIGANLDAGEVVYPGKMLSTTMDRNNTANTNITATDIIVSAEQFGGTLGLASANSITRGDRFEILTGNGLNYTYEYGGYTTGRNITQSTSNFGDGGIDNSRTLTGDALGTLEGQFTYVNATTLQLNVGTNHGLVFNDQVVINGSVGAEIPDGNYIVSNIVSPTVIEITVPGHTVPVGGVTAGELAGATIDYNPYGTGGVIFDANSSSEAFFGNTGLTRFDSRALTFTISTSTDTHTFKYTASSPNALSGQFNSLATLAEAIDSVSGLTARVVSGGTPTGERLVVGAEDANEQVTFANGLWPIDTTSQSQTGIDWVSELDLSNVTAGARRFNSLQSLASIINEDEGVTAVVNNPLASASLDIRVDDPLDTINFRDLQDSTSFNIPQETAGDVTYSWGATITGDPIPVTVDFSVLGIDPATYGLNVGDQIVISGENLGTIELPFINTPGGAHASGLQLTVTAVDSLLNTFTFTIPGNYNINGTAGSGGPVNASGNAAVSILGEGNQGSLLAELFGDTTDSVAALNIQSLNGTPYVSQDTVGGSVPDVVGVGPLSSGQLGPAYDSSGVIGGNMASGDIVAQFSRNVRIYDALGAGHDIRYSYIKIAENNWAVEVHAIPETDISSSLPDGQIAVGNIQFNGDGSLRSISSSLLQPIEIVWTNGAIPSEIEVDWGTAGQPFGTSGAVAIGGTDGLSQFDSDYNVAFVNQNGAPVGELISIAIDELGFVIASYSNGETQNLYKLPLAEFANPNGLKAISGNVFSETRDSGTVNLREAGTNGVGDVVSASLEQSNVELSEQLTDMIVAQRAYQANTRVISTTDELLEQLNNL